MIFKYVLPFLAIPIVLILLVRFFKRPIAAFHRAVTNPVACRFAGLLPGFALIRSVGRKSGKLYRTPVNVFRQQNGFLVALTYGRESGWVANVIAAGACQLETRGVLYQVVCPVLVHDRSRQRFPRLVRVILGLINANDYLELQLSPRDAEGSSSHMKDLLYRA